jgi:DNA-binding phage protein
LRTTSEIWCITKMTKVASYNEIFRRGMVRHAFHSLFWAVLNERKRTSGLKITDLAEKLGVNKSFVSRSFSNPPNWRIDTLADFSDALDVDLVIEARDRNTGQVFTPSGSKAGVKTTTVFDGQNVTGSSNKLEIIASTFRPQIVIAST